MFFRFIRVMLGIIAWTVDDEEVPLCIQDKVDEILSEEIWNPPAKVWRYPSSRGSSNPTYYYYIPQRCCDIMSDLYDDQCRLLCHPDGGLTGMGSGTCPTDFDRWNNTKAMVLWEDERW